MCAEYLVILCQMPCSLIPDIQNLVNRPRYPLSGYPAKLPFLSYTNTYDMTTFLSYTNTYDIITYDYIRCTIAIDTCFSTLHAV